MGCGYACVNCGKCSGEARRLMGPGECPVCHDGGSPQDRTCSKCGAPLALPAGMASNCGTGIADEEAEGEGFLRGGLHGFIE